MHLSRTKLGEIPSTVIFGGMAMTAESPEKVFAFALADGSRPHVFDYEINEDGLASLASLMRSEHILAVVKGRKVNFAVESVVTVDLDNVKINDRMPLSLDGI